MDLVFRRGVEHRNGVAGLVIGRQPAILFGHDAGTLFGAHHHLGGGIIDILHCDGFSLLLGSSQRRLIENIFEVCSREAGRRFGDDAEVNVGSQRLIARMYLENLLTALHVGHIDINLAVKAAGAGQGAVKNVGAVGGRHDDNAGIGLKPVHLDQQLVERLLALVVAAVLAAAALLADGVDLVDENDTGRLFLGLLEQVAHLARAHADEHLHEL